MTPVLAATASEQAELIVFIVLAPLAVVTALGMVLTRNAVYSALLLVVNFFCLAGFYVLLEAQFVAAVQVIVYAGAIMVLFLFVLMLLGIGNEEAVSGDDQGASARRPSCSPWGCWSRSSAPCSPGCSTPRRPAWPRPTRAATSRRSGRILFTRYTFAFETAGVLLVVAAVGALVLGKRQP